MIGIWADTSKQGDMLVAALPKACWKLNSVMKQRCVQKVQNQSLEAIVNAHSIETENK